MLLQASGRQDEAQRRRWAAFEATLSIPRLRSFLKGLADFDDVVAEDDAKKIAAEFPRLDVALAFLIEWPDLAAASRLIVNRHGAINGADEDLLTAAARRLEGAYPLAATLLLARHGPPCADLWHRASLQGGGQASAGDRISGPDDRRLR
jgi:hypothetical protein